MAGIIPPGTAALWLGNNGFTDRTDGQLVRAMDLGGNLLIKIDKETAMAGVAFDGTNLWFSAQAIADRTVTELTKRTTDGTTVLDTFSPEAFSPNAEDLTFDTKRQLLWRIDNDPTTLVQIKRTTGAVVQSFDLTNDPLLDPVLKGGFGIAYDTSGKDVLYVSFGRLDGDPAPDHFIEGIVKTVDPNTGANTGDLFRINTVAPDTFATGGLAYQPGAGTLKEDGTPGDGSLWVSDPSYVRHMSLSGEVIARVRNPQGDLHGLEFVSGTC